MKIAVIIPYLPDDSTEALYERCKDSLDSRFEVIRCVDYFHEGVSKMRNRGLQIVFTTYPDTDYITFLDADDTYAPVEPDGQLPFEI